MCSFSAVYQGGSLNCNHHHGMVFPRQSPGSRMGRELWKTAIAADHSPPMHTVALTYVDKCHHTQSMSKDTTTNHCTINVSHTPKLKTKYEHTNQTSHPKHTKTREAGVLRTPPCKKPAPMKATKAHCGQTLNGMRSLTPSPPPKATTQG